MADQHAEEVNVNISSRTLKDIDLQGIRSCRKTLRMKTYPKTPESYHINGRVIMLHTPYCRRHQAHSIACLLIISFLPPQIVFHTKMYT